MRPQRLPTCLLLTHALLAAGPAAAQVRPANELDAFMEKALARREVNRKTLEQYILDEAETFEIYGPGRTPIYRGRREYTWYVRDGMHVRSPVRFNGVAVGERARAEYEEDWIRRETKRLEQKRTGEPAAPGDGNPRRDGPQVSSALVPVEPRFVSEAYFLEFAFEPGNYYLAGRDTIEGQEVLKIEYYPTAMFGDGPGRDRDDGPPKEPDPAGQEIDRRMNKTALITLWVDPAAHQIVKYTFENVWLDFLPGAWLVRVDGIRATMIMGQPFEGVWLPRGLDIAAGFSLATGSYEGAYARTFSGYRLAEVSTKIRVPRRQSSRERAQPHRLIAAALGGEPGFVPAFRERGPSAGLPDLQPAETIAEIRVHGNAFLTDAEVLGLAAVAEGQALGPDGVAEITRRLEASGRFESIEVRKRYRSLSRTHEVALVLVVHEKPGVRPAGPAVPGLPDAVAGRAGRLRSTLMFLPILGFADGYGFTYGGRLSTLDLLGAGERLSLPLTWGGTRRAVLEFEREFARGPITRIGSSVGIWNRRNPRFDVRDQRLEWTGLAERVFADVLRATVDASRSTISFAGDDDRLWTAGTSLTLDTRRNPAFPGHAVLLGAGWTAMHAGSLPGRINRYTLDSRAYLRVFRQAVLAGRAQYTGADRSLPRYERLLLGGAPTLRGFRAGSFDGDRILVTSAELRVPLTSVLSGAKVGVSAFYDAGTAWDAGHPLSGAAWHRGAGGGLFLVASIVRLNVDVARGLGTGRTRLHVSSGFVF